MVNQKTKKCWEPSLAKKSVCACNFSSAKFVHARLIKTRWKKRSAVRHGGWFFIKNHVFIWSIKNENYWKTSLNQHCTNSHGNLSPSPVVLRSQRQKNFCFVTMKVGLLIDSCCCCFKFSVQYGVYPRRGRNCTIKGLPWVTWRCAFTYGTIRCPSIHSGHPPSVSFLPSLTSG